jgi:hypothetical protein
MLPTCIGISGVSRYRNEASIDVSFLASLMLVPPADHAAPWWRFFVFQTAPVAGTLVRIVHFPEAHMQWQTARIGQIA